MWNCFLIKVFSVPSCLSAAVQLHFSSTSFVKQSTNCAKSTPLLRASLFFLTVFQIKPILLVPKTLCRDLDNTAPVYRYHTHPGIGWLSAVFSMFQWHIKYSPPQIRLVYLDLRWDAWRLKPLQLFAFLNISSSHVSTCGSCCSRMQK